MVGEIGVAVGQELEGMDTEKKAGTMGENLGSNISPALKKQIEDNFENEMRALKYI